MPFFQPKLRYFWSPFLNKNNTEQKKKTEIGHHNNDNNICSVGLSILIFLGLGNPNFVVTMLSDQNLKRNILFIS